MEKIIYFLKAFIHRKRLDKYYTSGIVPVNPRKTIVCMADGRQDLGGLADRIRGILSMFEYSRKNGLDFKIYFTEPFMLSDYLVSNQYDWTITKEDLCYNKKYAMPMVIYENAYKVQLLKALAEYKKQQIHVYTNIDYCDDSCKLFHILFKPSDMLHTALKNEMKKINGDYISISFRFHSVLGDFTDTVSDVALPEGEKVKLIEKCKNAVNDIKKKNSDIQRVLVTSDSNMFIAALSSLVYVYTVPGKIIHTAIRSEDKSGYLKTFVEFMLISNAKKVYLVKDEKTFLSGFSRYAALINNRPFELVNI